MTFTSIFEKYEHERLGRVAEVMGVSKEDLEALRLVAPSHKSYGGANGS